AVLLVSGCKKKETPPTGEGPKSLQVGLVVDVGGRGDQSFNDSALRGLELWAAGVKFSGNGYVPAPADEISQSITPDLKDHQPKIEKVAVSPIVLNSKAQEDYEPNMDLLVQKGAGLVIGTGFMLENATEAVAKRNPNTKFLLIDSPLLDPQGKPYTLPNVKTVVFREEEGSFLVGALAGLVTKSGNVGFVGGMEIPLIKKFEAGFRAGLSVTNPDAAKKILVTYTGSFDNVQAGKQVASDLLAKGADVIFHAAGSDGVGVIQAVKEARASGKPVWVIGVDSDQSHLAPDAVLTSMVKRVDLAVYDTVRALADGKFEPGDSALGLKQQGVTYAEVRVDFPGKAEALQKVEALRQKVINGEIKVPSNVTDLAAFKGPL
ncbi:MAG: BMP family protein, partial [Myxococcaceae bacterium]